MIKKTMIVAFVAALGLLLCGTAWAKVSADEAARLGKDLTPFGAEMAGNAEGTIPAWDGGIKGVPEGIGYKGPGDFHPDPFKDDKVLFSIDAGNVDQYADKMTKGMVALVKKLSTLRLDVYQTRRAASAPQWIYDNTKKNATLCDMTEDGLGVIANGGYGGIPFPIPQSANEIVWNHNLRWRGPGLHGEYHGANGQSNGTVTRGEGGIVTEAYPWYDPNGSAETFTGVYWSIFVQYQYPARRNGEIAMLVDPLDLSNNPRRAWQYLPGQRRVRRAPSIAYDTPNPAASGLATYDDVFIFNGSLDRFDWKVIGKKEMYIPYNNYQYDLAPDVETLITAYHPNNDYMRWELHRVWIVEGTVAAGKRHMYAKRVLYMDEDTWGAVAQDAYDSKGNLWRASVSTMKNIYEIPAVVPRSYIQWDLTRDDYTAGLLVNGCKEHLRYDIVKDESYFTPENVRRVGRR